MSKVLIVEDNDHLNNAYKIILEKNGHDVAATFDGAEGLVKAGEFKPEVILLDLLMPNKTGLEFLKEYDVKKHPDVKIIILTNLGEEKQVKESMALGAHRYILKAHASPQQLASIVNHVVKKESEPRGQ
jgi:DNA-binding response OmpR family regulator